MYRARGNAEDYRLVGGASGQNCSSPPTNRRYRTLIGAAQSETRHQLRAPRSRLAGTLKGARYGAQSISGADRKKPGGSFGETMNAVRIWLDHRDIRSTSFLPITQIDGGIGFEIGFNNAAQAQLFEHEFA